MKKKTKTNKTAIFGLLALVVVGLVFSTAMVSAYRGDYATKGPNCDAERHELMEQAFDTGDYNEWYELMTADGRNPRVVEVVTEDNFELFAEAHEAAENGNPELAAQIRAELGLNNGVGPRDGSGYGKGMGEGKGQGLRGAGQGMKGEMRGNCLQIQN